MTKEEALRLSKIELEIYEKDIGFKPLIEFQKFIVEALEKQIPKKIDVIFCPSVGKVANVCPSCGYDSFGDNEDKYCIHCGQAIDWGEVSKND